MGVTGADPCLRGDGKGGIGDSELDNSFEDFHCEGNRNMGQRLEGEAGPRKTLFVCLIGKVEVSLDTGGDDTVEGRTL